MVIRWRLMYSSCIAAHQDRMQASCPNSRLRNTLKRTSTQRDDGRDVATSLRYSVCVCIFASVDENRMHVQSMYLPRTYRSEATVRALKSSKEKIWPNGVVQFLGGVCAWWGQGKTPGYFPSCITRTGQVFRGIPQRPFSVFCTCTSMMMAEL